MDPGLYYPEKDAAAYWDLGYLGTYSADRQPPLERLLLEPARRRPEAAMIVAGPQYPAEVEWPGNVARLEHLPPSEHPLFYNEQAFTLNITRAAMLGAGFSPSVRVFEAAACGVPIITDDWPGLEHFFVPGEEIFVARRTEDVTELLAGTEKARRREVGARGRARVLGAHTAAHRAAELEAAALDLIG